MTDAMEWTVFMLSKRATSFTPPCPELPRTIHLRKTQLPGLTADGRPRLRVMPKHKNPAFNANAWGNPERSDAHKRWNDANFSDKEIK